MSPGSPRLPARSVNRTRSSDRSRIYSLAARGSLYDEAIAAAGDATPTTVSISCRTTADSVSPFCEARVWSEHFVSSDTRHLINDSRAMERSWDNSGREAILHVSKIAPQLHIHRK